MILQAFWPVLAAIPGAYIVARSDFARRRLSVPIAGLSWISFAATVFAACFQAVSLGSAAPHPVLLYCLAGSISALIATAVVASSYKIPQLMALDIAFTATSMAFAVACIAWFLARPLIPTSETSVSPLLGSAPVYEFLAGLLICWFLWSEGRHAMQWQRPNGIVASEYLILTGGLLFVVATLRRGWPHQFQPLDPFQIAAATTSASGLVLLAAVLRRYFAITEERRIVQHVARWGESTQPEYTPATPECRHPERWKMYDTMTAELEVLQFLKALVVAMKPALIVETGTFTAISTIAMAGGLQENGFGKIITCELDPEVFAKAKERIDQSGVAGFIECRNESSLEMRIDGTIDILFCDSDHEIRESEVRRFLPQLNPNGLVLMHDASTHYKIVREAALRLQDEGLLSVVLLPSPRGLVIAQPRASNHS
jgi:predicted O-methyltransferase YrrM